MSSKKRLGKKKINLRNENEKLRSKRNIKFEKVKYRNLKTSIDLNFAENIDDLVKLK